VRTAVGGLIVAALGVLASWLAVDNAYGAFLMPAMRWPLLASGAVMAVLGAATLVTRRRVPSSSARDDHDGGGHDGHEHHGMPRVAWLLLLPLLAVVLVQPPALGADAARRDGIVEVARPADAGEGGMPGLPAPVDGAVELTNGNFMARSYYDRGEGLAGVRVRLTGFVVRQAGRTDGYQLVRFAMACCAGDAVPIRVDVRGAGGPVPPDDTWLEVEGEWVPPEPGTPYGPARGATLRLLHKREIEAPDFPYE
jgi:uncharacterized repeat protein (TIGR03943 family)